MASALALTFLAYCGSLGYQFVDDDRAQIITNSLVHSWRFAPRYFTEHVWATIVPGSLGNYYRPLFLLWLRVNHMLFGLRPWGWHLTTILAHLGVTLAVYFLAGRIIGNRLTAAVATLIFGLHPVHVEGVVWVSGVTEPLLGLLFIPSFLCYLKMRDGGTRRRAWLATSLLLYTAALFAKETGAALPIVIFAYEWVFSGTAAGVSPPSRGQRIRNAVRRVAPYVAITPVYLIARTLALKGFSYTLTPLGTSTIILTWPSVLWFYLKLLVWPVGLTPWYDLHYVARPGFVNVVLPALGLASAALLLWVWARESRGEGALAPRRRRSQVVAFASAWLLVPIIPLLNLSLLPRDGIAHDRYMYLPSVGLAVIAALALRSIEAGRARLWGQPTIQVGLTTALALFFAMATIIQSLDWSDDLVLYYRGLGAIPESYALKANLANALAGRGVYDEALKLYHQVLEVDPNNDLVNYNLGYVYYRLHNLDEAERYLRRAVSLKSDSPESLVYLGLTELRKGRLDDAAALIHRAVIVNPDAYGVHFARGMVLKLQGDLGGALEEFRRELALNPEQASAREQIAEIEQRSRSPQS